MRILLIDPGTHTVAEIEHDGQVDHRTIQKHLGDKNMACAGRLPSGDFLWVDDEGLLHGPRDFFHFPAVNGQPLAGVGVITGPEVREEIVDARTTLEELKAGVIFLGRMQATSMTREVTKMPNGVHIHIRPTIEPA